MKTFTYFQKQLSNSFLICLLISTNVLWAQDSEYVTDFTHKINVKLGLDTNTFSYKVTDDANNRSFELRPNESARLTTSFHYKFLGLAVGFSPGFINNAADEDLKGDSDISTIKLRVFIKRFIQEVAYYKIKGFYVNNTGDFVSGWVKGQDPYLQLTNMTSKRYGGRTSFVMNKNFSYKALLVQNEKQARSAGSFVPALSYFYTEIENPQNLLLTADQKNIDVNVNAGYIHNFVFGPNHNFYASLGLSPGFGLKFARTLQEDGNGLIVENKETHPNFTFDGSLNLGYNSDKIFTGLQLNTFTVSYQETPETQVEDSNIYFQLFFGYRFGAPKSVERFFDSIYKK